MNTAMHSVFHTELDSYPIKGVDGRLFEARLLYQGDPYGLENCLRWDSKEVGIEFYDMSAYRQMFPEGQFVSRYYLGTLIGSHIDETPPNWITTGINLQGDVPHWSLPRASVVKTLTWASMKARNDLGEGWEKCVLSNPSAKQYFPTLFDHAKRFTLRELDLPTEYRLETER
jgi:hypothetical protein